MSVDFTKPVATADRAQNLTDTKDTLVAVAKQLDDTTPTGVATGMIRWSTTNNKWQKYNGTSWVDLAATFSMNVSSLGGQVAANYLLSATAASTYLAKAGGTLTGFLTLHAAPTADMHAATKKYADDKVAALPILASGTWTPTAIADLNVSTVIPYECRYIRVGNIVSFAGSVYVNPTNRNNASAFRLTLPINSAWTSPFQASGVISTSGAGADIPANGTVYCDPAYPNVIICAFGNPPSPYSNSGVFRFSGNYLIV